MFIAFQGVPPTAYLNRMPQSSNRVEQPDGSSTYQDVGYRRDLSFFLNFFSLIIAVGI